MNRVEAIECFEATIAIIVDKMAICDFYTRIYIGIPLYTMSGSITNTERLEDLLTSALPELYAAVIVFSIYARRYFESRGKVISTINIISL